MPSLSRQRGTKLARGLIDSPAFGQTLFTRCQHSLAFTAYGWLRLSGTCLKVGIASPRRRDGIRGRLKLHLRNNPDNTVLCRAHDRRRYAGLGSMGTTSARVTNGVDPFENSAFSGLSPSRASRRRTFVPSSGFWSGSSRRDIAGLSEGPTLETARQRPSRLHRRLPSVRGQSSRCFFAENRHGGGTSRSFVNLAAFAQEVATVLVEMPTQVAAFHAMIARGSRVTSVPRAVSAASVRFASSGEARRALITASRLSPRSNRQGDRCGAG